MNKVQLNHDAHQSYTEYKKCQKLMTKWLIEHGEIESRKHDYQIYAPHYRLPLSEINRLAKSVKSLGIPIPADMLYISRTMLKLRRQVAITYDDGDEGHQKCIEQFGEIISALESLPKVNTERQYMTTRQQPLVTTDIHVSNQYVALSDDASDPVALTNHSDVTPPCQPTSFARKPGSLEHSPSIPKQKFHIELSNPMSIDVGDERVAGILQIQNLTCWTFRVCSKARDGMISFTVAAFVIERAFMYIQQQWEELLYFCIRYRSTKNFTGRVTDDVLEKVKGDLAEAVHQHNRLASSDGSALTMFNLYHDFDEPIMHLSLFAFSFKFDCLANSSMVPSAKPKLYAENIPDPRNNTENERYFVQLLQDLMYDAVYRERERTIHGTFEGHSRIHSRLELFLNNPDCGLQNTLWGNTLFLLLKTAQYFLYGYPEPCSMLGTTDRDHHTLNFRLKILMFAQEVHTSLKKHWPGRNPMVVSLHTWYNLETLQAQLEGLLKHRRFDMFTQHPLMAMAISSTIMDTVYKCGIEMLSFRRTVLGVLHVYNALRGLHIVNEDIEILEIFCNKLVDEVFYGKRPIRRFLTAWIRLDDPANNEQSSAQEHRTRKELMSAGVHWPKKIVQAELLHHNSRGMYVMKDGRKWHNQRIQGDHLSLFHQVYNMDYDKMPELIPEKLLQRILGDDFMHHPAVIQGERKASKTEKAQRDAKPKISDESTSVSREQRLNILEEGLTKEFTEAFPLITADLLQFWHKCYQACVAVRSEGHVLDHEHPDKACVDCVLEACDEHERRTPRKGNVDDSLGEENTDILTEDNSVLVSWKEAIEEQFRHTVLADFQWKNV